MTKACGTVDAFRARRHTKIFAAVDPHVIALAHMRRLACAVPVAVVLRATAIGHVAVSAEPTRLTNAHSDAARDKIALHLVWHHESLSERKIWRSADAVLA